MSSRGNIDVRWAAFVALSAAAAAAMANVFAQYLTIMWAAFTTGPVAAVPDFLSWLRAQMADGTMALLSTRQVPLAASSAAAAIVANAAMSRRRSAGNLVDPNVIHGSSRFATPTEMERYAHTSAVTRDDKGRKADWPKPECCEELLDDNYILTERAMLSISANPNRAFERNKHVFVMAGSGAGKTWNFVQSNVLNLGSSMVFTDPKGEILERNGAFLLAHGYKLKVVNVKDEESFANSNRYNPFHYCRNATAVNEIVDLIMENTTGDGPRGGGNSEFFEKAERQLYNALGGYLFFMYHERAEQYCTIPQMIDLLALTRQDPNAARSQLDLVFNCTEAEGASEGFVGYREYLIRKHGSEQAARMSPEWYPITEYEGFCTTKGSPETIASIIASCYVRLAPFAISSVRDMFSYDDLELERMADEKTALFIVTSAQKGTYDFIAAMLLYQLFDVLTSVADTLPGKHLPSPICCYLDEVANIGKIPGLEKQVAVLRSYWVNLIVIVQSETDLERAYGREKAKSIRNNCDTTLYLGRGDIETCEKISKEIGDTTRSYVSWSTNESATGRSVTKSVQYVKVPLRTPEQIANEMPANGCYLHFKEERWFEDAKANPMEHRRYREWSAMPPFDIRTWARDRRLARGGGTGARMEPDGSVTVVDERHAPDEADGLAYIAAS